MPALVECGGGSSSARPGFGTAVAVGVAQIAATLNNVPTPLAVLAAGYIGAVGYQLSTFCNTDPPAMPTIDGGDWAALLTVSDPVGHLAAQQKFQDMLANYFWPLFCQCDSTTTPAQPALPAPPADLPTANPPQVPTAPTSGNCWDATVTWDAAVGDPDGNVLWNKVLWPDNVPADSNTSHRVVPTPLPSEIVMTLTVHGSGGTPVTQVSGHIACLAQDGTLLQDFLSTPANSPTCTVTVVPPANTHAIHVGSGASTSAGTAGTGTYDMNIIMYCSGQSPNTPLSPCCPPDPSLQASLNTILSLVQAIYEGTPTPLTSYADGTAHSTLSGDGTITLAEAKPLAVRVDITTDPSYLGEAAGFTPYLFDRGFIVPVINGAPIRAKNRLVFNPQMFALPALTEEVGYSLSPGVVVSITELTAGP